MDAVNSAMGCYVLMVVSEPLSEDHKQVILQKLSKGLLSWDIEATGCDLTGLQNICSSVKDKGVSDNDVLIQYSTESLGVEVLINPPVSTLKQCIKNLLESSTGHKHLIHAGYTFSGSGSWILENGTFCFRDFLSAFQDARVQCQNGCTIHIHCAEEGEWTNESFAKETFTKVAKVLLNPSDCIDSLPGSEHLVDCLSSVLNPQSLDEIMTPSPLVGNVRFSKPTIYVFPAGEGDCALFGVKGFNMIIDGGFSRKPCSWEFIRHLDRVDAVLVTHLSENNLCGISTLMQRKTLNNPYPNFGYVFCNIGEGRTSTPTGAEELQKDKDDLLLSVVRGGHQFVDTLSELKLKPHQCWGDNSVEPIVLYHKVGDGTLEMHILNPTKDSKEMKDFLSEWNSCKERFSSIKSGVKNKGLDAAIPLPHATSICAILVWRPSDPKDPITRIFFSGSAPQSKILASVEKLKNLDILRQPMVTKASLNNVILAKPKVKSDKLIPKTLPNRKNTASPALSVSSVASRNGDIASRKENKDLKKNGKNLIKDNKDIKKDNKETKRDIKDIKPKPDKKVLTTISPKKPESSYGTPKSNIDAKKPSQVKKLTPVLKKDVSKPSTTNMKSSEKHDAKKSPPTKAADTKTAKDVSNKKAAEAKSSTKTKAKALPSTTPKTEKGKTTPVPKAVSKVSKTSMSIVSAASLGAAVASPIISEAAKEKEVSMSKILDETAFPDENIEEPKISPELEVAPTPPDAALLTPSDTASPTPSDTLSSAPLETVSPTPQLPDISSMAEEKDVNEIKEVTSTLQAGPEEDGVKPHSDDVVPNASDEVLPSEFATENAHEEDFGVHDETRSSLDSDQVDEKPFPIPESSNDCMSASFIEAPEDDDTADKIEEEMFSKSFVAKEESAAPGGEKHDMDFREVAETESISNDAKNEIVREEEIFEHDKDLDENLALEVASDDGDTKRLQEIDLLLAGATMEGSICVGYDAAEDAEELQNDFNANNQSTDETLPKDEIENVERSDSRVDGDFEEGEIEIKEDEKFNDIMVAEDNLRDVDSCESQNVAEAKSDEAHLEADIVNKENSLLESEERTSIIRDYDSEMESKPFDHHDKFHDSVKEAYYGENFEISEESCERNIICQQESQPSDDFQAGLETESLTTSFDANLREHDCDSENQEEIEPAKLTVDHDALLDSEVKCDEEDHSELSGNDSTAELSGQERDLPEAADDITAHSDVASVPEDDRMHYPTSQILETPIDDSQAHAAGQISDGDDELYDGSLHYEACRYNKVGKIERMNKDLSHEVSRRESSVSIVLEGESDRFESTMRRESAADSEDDVDINSYMIHDSKLVAEEGKLSVNTGDSDSDDDDVVKSPTPHAVVDYGGQMDNICREPEAEEQLENTDCLIETKEEETEVQVRNNDNEMKRYSSEEKQDFNEKDRDSAEEDDEEQEGDDEMIRHPTPPGNEFYSTLGAYDGRDVSDDMRDPITQHLNLSPRQGTDVIEDPLYEEPEDSESEDSLSPVVEQPVYGNVVEADFPELVNVSGATTPSEPQSPKSTQDPKMKGNNFGVDVLEALSEHDVDCSETSLGRDEPGVNEEDSFCEESAFVVEANDQIAPADNFNDQVEDAQDSGLKILSNMDHSAPAEDEIEHISKSPPVDMSSSFYGDFSHDQDSAAFETSGNILEPDDEYAAGKHSTPFQHSNTFEVMDHGEDNKQLNDYGEQIEDQIIISSDIPSAEEKEMQDERVLLDDQINEGDSDEASFDHEVGKAVEKTEGDYSALEKSEIYQNEEVTKDFLETESFHTNNAIPHEASTHGNVHSSLLHAEDEQLSLVCELNGNRSNHYEGDYVIDNDNSVNDVLTELQPISFETKQDSRNGMNPLFQCNSQQEEIMTSDLPKSPESPCNDGPGIDARDGISPTPCHLPATAVLNENSTHFPGDETSSHKFYQDKEDHPYGESSEDEDTSSLPGNVSPYAYTNKAYAQEEDENEVEDRFHASSKKHDEKSFKSVSINPVELSFTVDNSVTSRRSLYSPDFEEVNAADSNTDFHLEEWGKPMGLPTPPEAVQKSTKTISKAGVATKSLHKSNESRSSLGNGKHVSSSTPVSKSFTSPLKTSAKGRALATGESTPVYVDLAYVPHHGDPDYCDVEFFKKIRARYYVFSGINPSKEVLNALLEAKKSWKEDIEVTIIPTHETDTLGYWMAQNQDTLTEYSIDVAPSASRCTVNLQDHETSCAAYRLEF